MTGRLPKISSTRGALRDRVVGANILRRHLTTGQRAMTAAALANMTQADNQWSATTNSSELKSTKDSADQLNVGTTAVKVAKAIKRDAPDLAEKVSRGEMSLNAAKMLWY